MKKYVLFLLFSFPMVCQAQAPEIDWMKQYGGSYGDFFRTVIPTQDGGFLMGGWSNSGVSGVKTDPMICSNFDYWVIKIDALGNVQWQKTIGGGRTWGLSDEVGEILNSVSQSADGSYYLGGYADAGICGQKTVATYGMNDFWIVKIDPLGNILWQVGYGGSDEDQLYAIQATADGGCIAGGPSFQEFRVIRQKLQEVFMIIGS